jgi:hypothetical protein
MHLLSPLDDLLDLQDGVISRKQALELPGESDATVRRRLRRREWVTHHPRVYRNHTGDPTWKQRAWAAVLYAAPAALAGASALRASEGPGRRSHSDDDPIEIAVDISRDVREQAGIRIHRRVHLDAIVQTNLSPPRIRTEHAAIDAAAAAPTDLAAIALLSDVVRSRRSTPARLLAAARSRSRLPRRHLLQAVLADAASGCSSVLEEVHQPVVRARPESRCVAASLRPSPSAHQLDGGGRPALVLRPGDLVVDERDQPLVALLHDHLGQLVGQRRGRRAGALGVLERERAGEPGLADDVERLRGSRPRSRRGSRR